VTTQIPTLTSDPNFTTILPTAIDYAELSIYRDLDFVALHGNFSMGTAAVGVSTYDVPSGFVVLETMFYGDLLPITPASQEFIRLCYAGSANGPPECFCVMGSAGGSNWTPAMQVLLGPAPDQTYLLTAYGTNRQVPLSASNPTTFISENLPDLFWAASMIFFAGYNRNFGAMSDDPRQAISWEQEYQRLLKGAEREEIRKKFLAREATAQYPQARVMPPMAPQPGAQQ
jgi:hypothetical protein